ncbi:hypothetical protein [Caballeronia sp. LZ035]|uniref:hypothetical protein n=1 Tax=Caballeronia sp. LZ035 TaxID=3038568 RepID=UPI002861348D|nr:hypothetical protein [Caballeronia sp. LZ035]MDR5760446.1 hypothetical protein [Caballeronia sp. LZ035]
MENTNAAKRLLRHMLNIAVRAQCRIDPQATIKRTKVRWPIEKTRAQPTAKAQPIFMHRHQATFYRMGEVPCLHRLLEASLIEAIEPAASGTATE